MLEVLNVIDCTLDLVDDDGIHHYVVTADIADVRLARDAVLYPADIAEPAQYKTGQCSATLALDLTDEAPPQGDYALRRYIQDQDLDWELDDPQD